MEPLKVLVITSRPLIDRAGHALQLMSVTEARRLVRKCFKTAKIPVQIKFVPLASASQVKAEAQFEFDVLYYFGYGDRTGSLYLEDGYGKAVQIDPSKFADLFNLNFPPGPKLIVFSGCHSELIAGRIYDFDVPSIAIMGEKPINEQAMALFHQSFWFCWTKGDTLSESFAKGVLAVRNDPEAGDRACRDNFLYSDHPVPFSERFFLFSGQKRRISRLVEKGNRDNEGKYQEYLEDSNCFLPPLSEHFVGRESEIHEILELLKKKKVTVISGKVGSGKTELVKAVGWYLQERGFFKKGIFWASSRDDEIRYPFKDFETFLNSVLSAKTRRELEHLRTEKKYREVKELFDSGEALLVLNNLEVVEGEAGLLRLLTELSSEGRVLLASTHDLPARLVKNYRIGPLPADSGHGYLEKVLLENGPYQECPQKMAEAAACEQRLYKLVDGHIAALELTAGRLINKSFDTVWQKLSEIRQEEMAAREMVVREAVTKAGAQKRISQIKSDEKISAKKKAALKELEADEPGKAEQEAADWKEEKIEEIEKKAELEREALNRMVDNLEESERKKALAEFERKHSWCGHPKTVLTAFELNFGDLTPGQEKIFLGLSLFFGPANSRAVGEILAVDSPRDSLEVLVRRSLIKMEDGNYSLLPTAREFARKKINELDPDTRFVHQKAVEFYKRQTDLSILYLFDHLNVLGEKYGDKPAWRELIRYALYLGEWLIEGYYWRRAGQALERGLAVAKRLPDQAGEAKILIQLGKLCYRQGGLERTREHFQSALRIFQEIGDERGEAEALSLFGNLVLEHEENPEEALEAHRKSLLINEKLEDPVGQADQWSRLGDAYAAQGRLDEALNAYLNRQKLQESMGDLIGQADSWERMSGVYETGDDLESAIFYQEKAFLAFRRKMIRDREENASKRLKRLYQRMDEPERSLPEESNGESGVIPGCSG